MDSFAKFFESHEEITNFGKYVTVKWEREVVKGWKGGGWVFNLNSISFIFMISDE